MHRVHGIIRPGAVVCDLCANVSYSRFENQEHHKLVHELSKPPKENHVCEDCGKEFAKVKHLRVHKSRAHQDVSLRTCKVCGTVFPNVAEVYKHHLQDHPNVPCSIPVDGILVCQCKICHKILASNPALYTHYKMTHKLDARELNKYYEYKSVSTKNNLLESEKETQYTCEKCEKNFLYIGNLKKHILECTV